MEISEATLAAFTQLEKARINFIAGIVAAKKGEVVDVNKLQDKLIAELDNCKATFDKS